MRDKILLIVISLVVVAGIVYTVGYHNEEPTVTETARDEIGESYNFDNEYFVSTTHMEINEKIENEDTFIVFVGRET